jgi:predicted Kef-type K+ transport protein
MPDVSFTNLLIISAIAVLAPLTVGFLPRLRIPAVVLEIVAGIVVGPSVLGWVHVDLPVQILALFGLAFLLFLAGLEIDLHRLRGRVLRLAALGYLVTLILGVGAGAGFHAIGWVAEPLLLAIALSATSLGLVVPVLKDAGTVDSEVGQTAIAAATVADFAAIVLLSLFFSTSGGSTGAKLVLLVAFAALVVVTWFAVRTAGRSMRLGTVLVRLQDTTAEIRVRFAVVLLVAFTVTGLLAHPAAAARVPLFLAALLLVRGVPALLGLRASGPKATAALGLLQATSLPFIVTATQIGMTLGKISAVTGAALVCAGLLSVLVFPLISLALLRRDGAPARPIGTDRALIEQPT